MFKKYLLTTLLSLVMVPGVALANDATSSEPPSVTMDGGSGSVPSPLTCNVSNQKLYWNGSNWQCIAVGASSSTTGYAKGSIVGGVRNTGYANSAPCPGGTFAVILSSGSTSIGGMWSPGKYLCIKT